MIIYQSNGITINSGITPKGIEFMEYGDQSWPLIVYLHGIGEVGKTPSALLDQSPIARGWSNGGYNGFFYPDFFTKQIRVVAPVLKSGFWTPQYINDFLDEINTSNLTCQIGWSWGGGGTAGYINQVNPKYKFKCAIPMSMGNYSQAGVNVACPVKIVHAANDGDTPVGNSDTFYAGIPTQYKAGFSRPSSGGHYVWQNFLQPSTGIYEWIKSFSTLAPPVTYTEGKIELGSDKIIYGNFNGQRIKL